MKRLNSVATVLAATSALAPALPAAAAGYTSRRAARVEVKAILRDAKRTEPCGYHGRGHLSSFRVVPYPARAVSFSFVNAEATGCLLL
jgi:hypothetical protein